jgi:RNA polymerase sigma-70 factor (ECF subfamily)
MKSEALIEPFPAFAEETAPAPPRIQADARAALGAMFEAHFDFIWRFLRRLGVPPDLVDDAAQQVFLVATRKADVIEAAKARSFLLGTALRIASEVRRSRMRAREVATGEVDAEPSAAPSPEQLTCAKRELEALDRILSDMPFELRAVFVLFEIEGLSTDEIAPVLGLPRGTVSSRLRRARQAFQTIARRIEARRDFQERRS